MTTVLRTVSTQILDTTKLYVTPVNPYQLIIPPHTISNCHTSGLSVIDALSLPPNDVVVTKVGSPLLTLVLIILIAKFAVFDTPVLTQLGGVISLTGIVTVADDISPKHEPHAIAGKIVLLRHLTTTASHLIIAGSLGTLEVHHAGAMGHGPAILEPVRPLSDGRLVSVV